MNSSEKLPDVSKIITHETRRGDFRKAIDHLLQVRGDLFQALGQDALEKTEAAMLSLGVFACEPATFDERALRATGMIDEKTGEPLPAEQAQMLTDLLVETGFIRRSDNNRLLVSEETRNNLLRLLGEEADE